MWSSSSPSASLKSWWSAANTTVGLMLTSLAVRRPVRGPSAFGANHFWPLAYIVVVRTPRVCSGSAGWKWVGCEPRVTLPGRSRRAAVRNSVRITWVGHSHTTNIMGDDVMGYIYLWPYVRTRNVSIHELWSQTRRSSHSPSPTAWVYRRVYSATCTVR